MNNDLEKSFIYGLIILCICGLPVSFTQLIVGAKYFNQCSTYPMVPIFNVVAGVIGIVFEIAMLIIGYKWWRKPNGEALSMILLISGISFFLFFFAWYLYGITLLNFYPSNPYVICATPVQNLTNVVVIMYACPVVLCVILIFCFWCTPAE
jgi:hypothetical protein